MSYPAEYDDFELAVRHERRRQDDKWGEQNHPDGTGTECQKLDAQKYRAICEKATAEKRVTFRHILHEEVAEAFAETDPDPLKKELIQISAVCKQWIEAIDRRAERGRS